MRFFFFKKQASKIDGKKQTSVIIDATQGTSFQQWRLKYTYVLISILCIYLVVFKQFVLHKIFCNTSTEQQQ